MQYKGCQIVNSLKLFNNQRKTDQILHTFSGDNELAFYVDTEQIAYMGCILAGVIKRLLQNNNFFIFLLKTWYKPIFLKYTQSKVTSD